MITTALRQKRYILHYKDFRDLIIHRYQDYIRALTLQSTV